ncbi:MAG: MBL fold metallo-hydrolase [Bacteroidales bacterium]|nr:MBL fold metallo-hydrolase [Bacteroidales bacterium]
MLLVFFVHVALNRAYGQESGQQESGPYTIARIGDDVYNIQDANAQNPPGVHKGENGEEDGMNNCSDMYLILGTEKALLIDLSNRIEWYEKPADWLRKIIYDKIGNRQLIITVTHNHGDHLGMLPAFINDPNAGFWLPRADFSPDSDLFPQDRTVYFDPGASLDLGEQKMVETFLLPGHTKGSTLFFLKNENIVFTGDALGSGGGLWLFDYDSFDRFSLSFRSFMEYIRDPGNNISEDELILWGGHSWQKGSRERLGMEYLEDMEVLLEQIVAGVAESTPYTTFIPSLNANFRYKTAVITWNRESAIRYVEEKRFPPENDFTGKGPTHKGDNMELIRLLDHYTFSGIDPQVGDMQYYLYDPVAHGADPDRKYPLIVVFHGAANGMNGVMCAAYTDFVVYAGREYQEELGGAFILFPKANEYVDNNAGDRQLPKGTWMTKDETTGTSVYIPSIESLIKEVIKKHKIDPDHVIIGGTSAGGYMTWRFMAACPDLLRGAFLIAPADNPSLEEMKMYEQKGIHIWVIHGKKDEICPYDIFTGPVRGLLEQIARVRVTVLENVRYGDGGIVRMEVRGSEMGQHLPVFCVGSNMIYDDGRPYDPRYPDGFTGWLKTVFDND